MAEICGVKILVTVACAVSAENQIVNRDSEVIESFLFTEWKTASSFRSGNVKYPLSRVNIFLLKVGI